MFTRYNPDNSLTNVAPTMHKLEDTASRRIFFDVQEEPVVGSYSGTTATNKKMLLRSTDLDLPEYMSVVSKDYRVVPNREVLEPLQQQMINFFDSSVLSDIQIKDTISKSGNVCLAEYIFPKISIPVETRTGHKTNVGYRCILKNTFDGSGSLVFYGGAIDFFCTNGMILGEFDVARKRHTKNFTLDGFLNTFQTTLNKFYIEGRFMQRLAEAPAPSLPKVKTLFDILTNAKTGEEKKRTNLSDKLVDRYQTEVVNRGQNLFAVVSAMTHFSSHGTGNFALTKAGDETTLFKRQDRVANWLHSEAWKDFTEDCGVS